MKKRLRNFCFNNKLLKSIYCCLSYGKGKIYYAFILVLPILVFKIRKRKGVFLIFTPEHANLGDHAIAYAETKMLNELKIDFYEVTGRQLGILDQYKYLNVFDGRFILVNGGGNLGVLWPNIERLNRHIISNNPNSTIYILPNTIYYGDDYKELNESINIYNSHKHLYIYAREKISYEYMLNKYKNVKLVPDMVLSLNECKDFVERRGCILCLRNDVERTISEYEYNQLIKQVKTIFGNNYKNSDTVLNYNVSIANREKELQNKFHEFRSAELIITDRLHGMIFAAITGTNCIVINSKSPKIKGCYEWIKELNYIKFVNDIKNLSYLINEFNCKNNKYDNKVILKYMKILNGDVKKIIQDNDFLAI